MPEASPNPRNATTNQARVLRRRATLAERTLWEWLRDRRLTGLKFRRQVPKGPYILDFVCIDRGLVVEADGPFHDPERDAQRDRWLAAQGFRVLRFANRDVLAANPNVIDRILEAAETPHPTGSAGHLLPKEKGPPVSFSLREKVSGECLTDEGCPGLPALGGGPSGSS